MTGVFGYREPSLGNGDGKRALGCMFGTAFFILPHWGRPGVLSIQDEKKAAATKLYPFCDIIPCKIVLE